ncbi:MAG: SIR2 family protein [Clostridia bacterium]|nr:SIR2 family protein [Clostridia bacterium]
MSTDTVRPRVLLIGAGVLQAYGGMSWKDYLGSIAENKELLANEQFKQCPSPLQAILLTDDHVDKKLKEKKAMLLDSNVTSDCYDLLRELLRMGFDEILTTNYTYEFEAASLGVQSITERQLEKMTTHVPGTAERRYTLYTYNKVNFEKSENRIWHIHGEHRKPDSIVLGHYYYGNLLCKIKEEINKIDNNRWGKADKKIERGTSWIDAFLYGDIYCIGFGFGVFEFDLWWLLNRKARDRDNQGKMYFYEPKAKEYSPKLELLNTLKDYHGNKLVDPIDFDFETSGQNEVLNLSYQEFYAQALADMKKKIS